MDSETSPSRTPGAISSRPHPERSRKRTSVSSEEPRQKRKVTRACDICKSKKAKCSGTQPCASCERRGLTCLYKAQYLRGRPPTPERSTSDGNNHIEELPPGLLPVLSPGNHERLLGHHLSHLNTSQNPSESHPVVGMNLQQQPRLGARLSLSVQNHEVPSRGSPELEVAGQYSDSTSGLSFLQRAWQRLSSNQASQVLVNGVSSHNEDVQLLTHAGDKPIQCQGHVEAPSLSKARELVCFYFDVCIATYRILHRPTVEDWVQTALQHDPSDSERNPEWGGLSRPQAAIALGVLAIATFHEQKAKGSSLLPIDDESSLRQCDGLFSEASRLTDSETGFPKLESAQARLIQVLYLLTSSRMNQAWYTFGHALQIISALGLHRRDRSKRLTQKRDYIEDQCRKRTFWVAYTLDKYLGVIFGRPRHYHDDDIDQHFPDSINDEDMSTSGPLSEGADDCHIESLVHHAKLAQIAERISREVYSIKNIPDHDRIAASHRLGNELRDWKAALPPFLGAINPSSLISSFRRQATALKLAYSHAVMLAHRPFLLKSVTCHRDDMQEMAKGSIRECIAAAQSVLQSVDRMARDGKLFHAFWWTHYVCFCALSVVYVWAIQHSEITSDEDHGRLFDLAECCVRHLELATATNSPSRRYSIILKELRAEAKRKTARQLIRSAHTAVVPQGNPNGSSSFLDNIPASENQNWEPMFGSPLDSAAAGMPNLLDDWQTTDWLDLDSSAFGYFPTFNDGSMV